MSSPTLSSRMSIVHDSASEALCLGMLEVMTRDERKEYFYKLPLAMRDLIEEIAARYSFNKNGLDATVNKFFRAQTGITPRSFKDLCVMRDMKNWPR